MGILLSLFPTMCTSLYWPCVQPLLSVSSQLEIWGARGKNGNARGRAKGCRGAQVGPQRGSPYRSNVSVTTSCLADLSRHSPNIEARPLCRLCKERLWCKAGRGSIMGQDTDRR